MGPQLALIGNPPPEWWVRRQRQMQRNPLRFTGPSFTFMPFNPFQKFAVDLLGVGFDPTKKKNPPRQRPMRPYHVYQKVSDQRVSTEHATSKTSAVEQASARTNLHPSTLYARVVVTSDIDRYQQGLFGFDPDAEIQKERREEGTGQMEMFNNPRAYPSFITPKAGRKQKRSPMVLHSDPETAGLNFEERIKVYAARAAAGLDPLTGLPPGETKPLEWLEEQMRPELETRPLRAKLPPLPPSPPSIPPMFQNPGSRRQRFEALHKANEITSERMLPVTAGLIAALRALANQRRSQAALARELGVSKQHLNNIINGQRRRVDRGLVQQVHWLLNPRGAPGPGGYAARSGGISAANPAPPIHPQALVDRERYFDDLRAGHTDAAEYWRGSAGAYFTANNPPWTCPGCGIELDVEKPRPHGEVCQGCFQAQLEREEAERGYQNPLRPRVIPELARLMNPNRKRRRNRDAKWKKEPDTWEVDLDDVKDVGYFKEAIKKFRRFHETMPNKALIIRIPDGKKKTTRLDKVYVALGHRKQTPYTVDDWDSSKKETYWYHDHPEGKEPLMILDPQLGVVSDVGGSYLVDDWFYS